MTTHFEVVDPDLSSENSTRLSELYERAQWLIPGFTDCGVRRRWRSADDAQNLLRLIWDAATEAVRRHATDPCPMNDLMDLISDVRMVETQLYDSRFARHAARIDDVQRALAALSDARDLDDLHQRVAEELCTLGFDRAAVSSVEGGRWNYHTMVWEKNPSLARELVDIGQTYRPLIDETLAEMEIIRLGHTIRVYDVQDNPKVNRDLVRVSGCRDYVGAPIRVKGSVVGMLHGDVYHSTHVIDEVDSAALGLFADGVGHAMARVTMQSRLDALRSELDVVDRFTPDADAEAAASDAALARFSALSNRESEVMQLLAGGATNREIGNALHISEGTAKTHISHILRKVEAGNRAEAVSMWLRGGRDTTTRDTTTR